MSHSLKFSVASHSDSPTKSTINVRGFQFNVDAPQAFEGTNKAPTPFEYILAGYAGCINVVAHLTAKEFGIQLNDLSINISGDLNTDKLLGKSVKERAGYKTVYVAIITSTEIEPLQKSKWLKAIETRCPVSDNLANHTPIIFQLSHS
ncbi:OsmC family protein [Marivirga atlantica]|jgi:uncharacterized OsmC-like protein|uniref:OsmC family protein n=1 Tax=Marivirga atlantica TaxID=1548457 RepID=A0A937DEI8_9BACT|nr:OsmC family protein [Marivirga atlantica]MBL0765257.1 OsmC family protein [Marivirga atlantica]